MHFALRELPLPLRFRPQTPMSDEELLRFCAVNECVEVERDAGGDISVIMKPGGTTSIRMVEILADLDRWSELDGRGVCFAHSGFTLPDGSMRAAGAAWVERTRWDALSERDQSRYAPLCPDFVIELRSPSDNLAELQEKMERWIASGAQLAWLIDPVEQQVLIYRPGDSPETHHHPSSVQGTGVMAGFELVMARIWE